MNRPLIITLGVAVILMVLGIWVYLLLFGTPDEGGDVFSNLGFDFTPQPVTPIETPEPPVDFLVDTTSDEPLQQLTTRPVAGFVATTIASSSVVRYAEQGTGHIYQIDLATGLETLISRTTIPRVNEAHFSPVGDVVVLVSHTTTGRDAFAGRIATTSALIDSESLAPGSNNFTVGPAGDIRYTRTTDSGITGYSYTLGGELRTLFTSPFTEILVAWGSDRTFFYNRPAASLESFLYSVESGGYVGTPVHGFGFRFIPTTRYGVAAFTKDNQEKTIIYDLTTYEEVGEIGLSFIPEKCAGIGGTYIICAAPTAGSQVDSIGWYQGTETTSDWLWFIELPSGTATSIADLEGQSGRPLDVTELQVNTDQMYFINRFDNTLWSYRG